MNMSASRQSRPASIADEARAPCETPAESLEQQQVAAFDATVPDRGIESHRYRRGRGIAMLADGQDDSFHGKVEPLRGLIRTLCDNPYGLVAGLVCLAFGGGGKSFMH